MSSENTSRTVQGPEWLPEEFTPILPQYELYVRGADGVRGVKRFAKRFSKVWLGLPEPHRDKILSYWDRCESRPRPLIEFNTAAEELLGFEMRDFALWPSGGFHLKFHPLTMRMPFNVFRAMLAEVLAGVHQYAVAADTSAVIRRSPLGAELLLKDWKIDPKVIDEWCMLDGLLELRR